MHKMRHYLWNDINKFSDIHVKPTIYLITNWYSNFLCIFLMSNSFQIFIIVSSIAKCHYISICLFIFFGLKKFIVKKWKKQMREEKLVRYHVIIYIFIVISHVCIHDKIEWVYIHACLFVVGVYVWLTLTYAAANHVR